MNAEARERHEAREAERRRVQSWLTPVDYRVASDADQRLWEEAASRDYQQARRG